MRDELAEHVSQGRRAHIPVEETVGPDQVAETEAAELANLEVEANPDEEMVTQHTLSINCFLPGTRQADQSQQPPGRDRTPPTPSGCAKKKQRVGDPPPKVPSDAPSKAPPYASVGIVIREPTDASRPTA